jgi:hypothetical protein
VLFVHNGLPSATRDALGDRPSARCRSTEGRSINATSSATSSSRLKAGRSGTCEPVTSRRMAEMIRLRESSSQLAWSARPRCRSSASLLKSRRMTTDAWDNRLPTAALFVSELRSGRTAHAGHSATWLWRQCVLRLVRRWHPTYGATPLSLKLPRSWRLLSYCLD